MDTLTEKYFEELIERVKSCLNNEYIKTNKLHHYLSFDKKISTFEESLKSISDSYLTLLRTKDGKYINPVDVTEIIKELLEKTDPNLDFFIQNKSGKEIINEIQSNLEMALVNFNLDNNKFQTISTLQDILLDFKNQKGSFYCDSDFFDNARKAFNAVPDDIEGYPLKTDINEFCKTAYLNHFKELNPFDDDANLSIEEFKKGFGELTGFIQSQNEKEMINNSVSGSEAVTRKRRL